MKINKQKYLLHHLILLLLRVVSITGMLIQVVYPLDSLNGRIEATEIDIATKTAGRIETINVKEGFVKEGQELARMDTRAPKSNSMKYRHNYAKPSVQ